MQPSSNSENPAVDRIPESFFDGFRSAETRAAAEILERWGVLRGLRFRNGDHAKEIPSWYLFADLHVGPFDLVRMQPEAPRRKGSAGAPGIVSIDFRRMKFGYFADRGNRTELLKRLYAVIGNPKLLAPEKHESWISVAWSDLVRPGILGGLLQVFDWALIMVRANDGRA